MSTVWGSQWAPAVFPGSGGSVAWRGEAGPLVGVVERGGGVRVVAGVPGVPVEGVDVEVAERAAAVRARGGGRGCYKVVGLPAGAGRPEPAGVSCRGGVLEIRLKEESGGGEKGLRARTGWPAGGLRALRWGEGVGGCGGRAAVSPGSRLSSGVRVARARLGPAPRRGRRWGRSSSRLRGP